MNNKLEIFFYLLLRDHLPAGEVEQIVMDSVKVIGPIDYSNEDLINYAIKLTKRLT